MKRSTSALFALPTPADRSISNEIAAGMDAARRLPGYPGPSGLSQALAGNGGAPGRSAPSGLAAALAANGLVPKRA